MHAKYRQVEEFNISEAMLFCRIDRCPVCFYALSVNDRFAFRVDDHSRVRLQRCGIDYINASLVVAREAGRSYILTQVIVACCCYLQILFTIYECERELTALVVFMEVRKSCCIYG